MIKLILIISISFYMGYSTHDLYTLPIILGAMIITRYIARFFTSPIL